MRHLPNETYVATLNAAVLYMYIYIYIYILYDILNIEISHTFNHMILDIGCPQNVAGKFGLIAL